MLGAAPPCIENVELPLRLSGVRLHQAAQHCRRRLARAQTRHRLHGVEGIDESLGRQRRHAALDVDAERAHSEET